MPGRHALTVQLNPYGVGHAAVTLTDPSGQTYAGFGPRWHNAPISPGKFDVHTVPTGSTALPSDFSNVFGDDHRTYTVPITEEQARSAHAEISLIGREGLWYNAMKRDPRVCTTIVDRIMQAAGVNAGLYALPRVAYHGDEPVAFAGVVPSTYIRNGGYFSRVGVLQRHRGRDLQCRMMRVIEARARRTGWDSIVSDTTDNPVSANNFIRAGYRLFEPHVPWASAHTLYWRKRLR